MTPELLYRQIEALDRERHRALHVEALDDWSPARQMNALFLTVAEFADACKEYAIVFVRAGRDAATQREQVAPVALTGLKQGENLYVRADGSWDARYIPASLRRYPFAYAQVPDGSALLVFDAQWPGLRDGPAAANGKPAQALFDAAGEPSAFLQRVRGFLDDFRRETERTVVFGERLHALGLLQDMRFDATTADGEQLGVDGFLALDAKKFAELPDAQVLELFRSGILGLLQMHQLSLGNLQRLVERRMAGASPAAA
jgi:hypothetical protein